jgi:hypothetical protein
MRNFKIIFALFVSCLIVSCQKDTVQITPNSTKHSGAKLLDVNAEPVYYSINYNDHGSILVSQYKKRARKNSIPTGGYDGLTISEVLNRSLNGTLVQRDLANIVIADLNNTSYLPQTVSYLSKDCVIYRGGSNLTNGGYATYTNTQSGFKYVIGITSNTSLGNNYTNKLPNGPSFNVNVLNSNIISNGGPYKMSVKIPIDLTFKVTSSPGHFVLVPINDMLESTFLNKLTILQNGLQYAQ